MIRMIKCSCGGTFVPVDGLEGMFCDKCGAFMNESSDVKSASVESSYTEDKLKSVRGTPVNRFIIGSESKGRVEISIPIFASKAEQKQLIDQQLDLMAYLKSQIDARGLDIMPKR